MESYTKVNVQQLESLAQAVDKSKQDMLTAIDSYNSNINTIKSSGYMKGVSDDALEMSMASIKRYISDFSVIKDELKKRIQEIKDKVEEIDKEANQTAEDIFSKDPTNFTKNTQRNEKPSSTEAPSQSETPRSSDNRLTREGGVYNYNGHKETWYSLKEPGQTVTAREIPGKHVDSDGIVRDADGYVCLAMPLDTATREKYGYSYYQVVDTSWGKGKIYDCGTVGNTLDIYTNW